MVAGANLMLCTDSVAMHLAVAVQTYTIALFGATEPRKLLPPSDRFIGIKSPTTKNWRYSTSSSFGENLKCLNQQYSYEIDSSVTQLTK